MDIRVLRYFLTLANTETISGAAEVLHTTQPNLSRQLSELEKKVDRPLFTRGSRKITLTEEGVGCAFSFDHLINLSGLLPSQI